MSMKQAGGNRKPGSGAASGAGGSGGRQNLGRGRHSAKGPSAAVVSNGVYANMRMVHVLTSLVGTNCELKVKNGMVYDGVFKTYSPECDLVLDAANIKSPGPSVGLRQEDLVDSIIFKASDVVVVHFRDVDFNYARKDNFTDTAVGGRINGEHKEKDLEPWDGGRQQHMVSGSLESLDTDVSNGWDPNDMFKYNEEQYGIKSTYDSSLSTYTVALERDNSEEFLKREARAAQLAEEIEASSTYKSRVALENDERSEEEKYTAVVRGEREQHTLNREKYIPPGQRNREGMSWGPGRQNSPRLVQSSSGPPRPGLHDYTPSSGADQRVVNGGPPRMSPKTQRTPRTHRVPPGSRVPPGVDFMPHNAPGEVPVPPATRSSSSGGTWSSVVSGAHRPRSPRQNSMGGASPGPSPQTGSTPVEPVNTPRSASSPTASPAPNMAAASSAEVKDSRVQATRQNSPTVNKENMKPLESPPSINRPLSKGPPSMAPDHRKQIDNLKKFSVDFRLQSSSNPDPQFQQMVTKPPQDTGEKSKQLPLDKGLEGSEGPVVPARSNKPDSPGAPSPSSTLCPAPEQNRGPDVTSQGVQTSAPNLSGGAKPEDKEEDEADQMRKSTLNPNAHEFKPRVFTPQPKPATTPTPPRPQGQPSPSIVMQQPQQVYFPQMYPLTPVSPGVQKSIIWKSPAMYHVQMPHMTLSQSKPYRTVPNMTQQRSDQHHPQGTPTMMHPAAGPPIVAQSPAYSAQYFTCSPQQFASQQLMPHYQSQAQHVFSPVIQGQARMMAPPTHGHPGQLVSSTSQYGEQTHTMYVSQGPMPQQYAHPNTTLHPQPSATPTGQSQQGVQHGGNHPAPSPVQQHQAAAAAQALHMGNQPQQQMYQALAPTPPSMTPGPNPQSPQGSFSSAQQAVYLHPQQMQHGYNPSHMAHMQQVSSTFRSPSLHSEYILYEQAHIQSGMVPSHHGNPGHPQMMLMATQQQGGPQPQLAQNALNPIPVSSTAHFSYLAHPQVQQHHQQQL
ncbi:ataxin-2 isoform X9 [Oncorhynchus kisutch]|uniref:ataxin-2 isoform X9 n=1 Tax=Oncorhynchus kisutch TaxID=8019 RepID=UPI0012DCBDC9|nr:ataxin-2 isoform X9 [Oncorhynchus kisutch]